MDEQDKPNVPDEPDQPAHQPLDLPAACATGWISQASIPKVTRRGSYRTAWDGEPFPVTVTKPEPLDELRPIDYNGCMPLTFDADGNPEADSDPDAGQYE